VPPQCRVIYQSNYLHPIIILTRSLLIRICNSNVSRNSNLSKLRSRTLFWPGEMEGTGYPTPTPPPPKPKFYGVGGRVGLLYKHLIHLEHEAHGREQACRPVQVTQGGDEAGAIRGTTHCVKNTSINQTYFCMWSFRIITSVADPRSLSRIPMFTYRIPDTRSKKDPDPHQRI
jgi:hypothetical protein